MKDERKMRAILTVLLLAHAYAKFALSSHTCFDAREGEVRLRQGPSSREGRVDICRGGNWYSVCNQEWGLNETQLVCHELGFCNQGGTQTSNQGYQHNNNIPISINIVQVNCSGEELGLNNCSLLSPPSSCYDVDYVAVGVNCSAEIPDPPIELLIIEVDEYEIQLSWTPPNMTGCTDIEEYRVTCFEHDFCYESFTLTSNSTSMIIHDESYFLFEYCIYECCVSGYNSAGEGARSCVSRPRPPPPRNVTASSIPSSPTSLLVEWVEPQSNIYVWMFYYNVQCGTQSQPEYSFTQTTSIITSLSLHTTYTCCVSVVLRTYPHRHWSVPNCNNGTTYTEPPSSPENVIINMATTSLQLQWSTPEHNGTLLHYTVTCEHNDSMVWSSTTANNDVVVGMLQPFTEYTCCVSATNEGGEGNSSCNDTRTLSAPPSEPQNITTILTDAASLTIAWREPADSYGEVIQSYTVSCASMLHDITLEVYKTSAQVSTLYSGTNYTCCIRAMNAVGFGDVVCIQVFTGPEVNSQSVLVAAVSGGVLLALLALFVIMITVVICCCLLRRCMHKHEPMESQQRPNRSEQEHAYSEQKTSADAHQKNPKQNELKTPTEVTVKQQSCTCVKIKNFQLSEKRTLESDDIELPQLPTRRYLEDVELKRQLSEEPPEIPARLYLGNGSISSLMDEDTPVAVSHRSYHKDKLFAEGLENFVAGLSSQTPQPEREEKIYQPLIPARRYEGGADEETSVYQSLTQNRVKGGIQEEPMVAEAKVVNNSEGHYQPLLKQAKPGSMVNNSEGHYQPLLKRAEPSCYERVTPNGKGGAHGNNSEVVYQSLTKRDEPSHYQTLTIRAADKKSE